MTSASLEELTARVTDLESRAAHYERMAEDLSQVLARQDHLIERLSQQIRRLQDQEPDWAPSPQDGKPPPHY